MKSIPSFPLHHYRGLAIFSCAIGLTLLCLGGMTRISYAQQFPPPGAGYLDYNYGPSVDGIGRTPTESKPESKLWWNDGFWWGSMWNPTANQYHIYRLNWGTQTWEDTGTVIDDRQDSRGDALWDGAKLYFASHFAVLNASNTNNPVNYARLYRFSYDTTTHTYSLDNGFPVNINHDKTEALTLAKDSTGRLWITYVSRNVQADLNFYKVYINATTAANNDTSWGTPIALPELQTPGVFAAEGRTTKDDISAIIAFRDNGGNKIGILWSTQVTQTAQISGTNHINFAWHLDSNNSYTNGADWTLQKGLNALANTNPVSKANDHMNIKALRTATSGQLFAAIKFENQFQNPPKPTFPELGMLARDVDGTFVYRKYSTVADNDSRPLLLINEGDPNNPSDNVADLFASGEPQGSKICYKTMPLPAAPASLSTLGQFPTGNCGAPFIVDASGVYTTFRDPSSTKQNINNTTGLVALASDVNGRVYAHNVMGNPPPVVTAFGPGRNAAAVAATSVVTVTFSKPISYPTTVNNTTFQVSDGANPVAGAFSYNSNTRTVTFKPTNPFKANTAYTIKLTNGIKDTTNLLLDAFKSTTPNTVVEQWGFNTGGTTVQFAQPSYSVFENGGSANITVTLAAASAQSVSINYATSNGTASAPGDYTATNGTLTFAPNEVSKAFSVPIIDNNAPNSNKTVNLTLSSPNGVGLGLQTTAILTIIDNDGAPTLQFSQANATINENVGTASLTVLLSHATTQTVTVNYTTVDGTASAPGDYTASSGTLTFNAGATTATLAVPIINDNVHEGDEAFSVKLNNASGNGATIALGGDTAIVTIQDDDPAPSVLFSSATYTVAEGGVANVTVNLSNPSTSTVTVDYTTSDGTANQPGDYTTSNGTLTFNPGETSKSFTVATVDDNLSENNETVNVTLSNVNTNATLNAQGATALLTILDNDPLPTAQLSAASYDVAETAGKLTIQVNLSAPAGRGVKVHYKTSGGTAVDGTNYVGMDDNLIILPGQTSATFDISILNDNQAAGDKTFNLVLDQPVDVALGVPAQATVTLHDAQTAATVHFSSATYTVTESAGTAVIAVTLSGSPSGAVTVSYATSNGTALAGQDYTATSGALTFAPGEFSKTFSIPITQDTVRENNETVNLTLSSPANVTLGAPATATLTIIDGSASGANLYLPLIRR
ncbi:MAG: Calx-beta domain-containing protein [Caldilineaceae bacterium]